MKSYGMESYLDISIGAKFLNVNFIFDIHLILIGSEVNFNSIAVIVFL